ncbi:uncharacterized protein J3D65DRAFT_670610 [Phyllosticta citribraziliensis]|uniref:Uncharacterized protein n=1 Tax=Phyllosticta citribraziliensis TaxID=989973 RepID=A0ABR1LE82_9PEZI
MPAKIPARQDSRPFPLLRLDDHLLKCVIDKVVECDIEDGIKNGVWRPVYDEYGIPESSRPYRALVSLAQVNKQLRRLVKPRLFRTVRVLRRGHGDGTYCFSRDAFQHNAPLVVGGRPGIFSTAVLPEFKAPPVWLFKSTRSLAIHQFWQGSASWMTNGVKALLEAPSSLRHLHLDADAKFAQNLEQSMTAQPAAALGDVTELIISIEMSFLLEHTPNVERLSNKTFSGCITISRQCSEPMIQKFYRLCQSLPKLRTLQLTVANFDRPFRIDLPPLSLTSLSLSNEEFRSHYFPGDWDHAEAAEGPADEDIYCKRVNMRFLVGMIRSQPGLVDAHIPRPEKIDALDDDKWTWDWKGGLSDMLPAAIIAALVPTIQRVLVGRSSIVDIVRREGEQTVLRLSGDSSAGDDDDNPRGDPRFIADDDSISSGWPMWQPVPEPCWHTLWDDWKEPILTMKHRRNVDILGATLTLSITHGEPDTKATAFIVDEEGRPTSVEVNLGNPRLKALLGG